MNAHTTYFTSDRIAFVHSPAHIVRRRHHPHSLYYCAVRMQLRGSPPGLIAIFVSGFALFVLLLTSVRQIMVFLVTSAQVILAFDSTLICVSAISLVLSLELAKSFEPRKA